MKKLLNMKKLLMIVGMMLAANLTVPLWAAEQAQPATDGKNPPATIAWGEAVDGVQVGLVPLGGVKGDGWGKEQDLFHCPRCAQDVYAAVVNRTVAAQKRVCACSSLLKARKKIPATKANAPTANRPMVHFLYPGVASNCCLIIGSY
jgi:hypothetical protein